MNNHPTTADCLARITSEQQVTVAANKLALESEHNALEAEVALLIARLEALKVESKSVKNAMEDNKAQNVVAKLERDLRLEYTKGNTNCPLLRHHVKDKDVKVEKDGKTVTYKTWRVRSFHDILADMTPYKPAECRCQRDALAHRASQYQPIGTLQTEWVNEGSTFKGTGQHDPKQPCKKVMPLKFRCTAEQFDTLHKRFPNYLFLQTETGSHDHPVAHTCTQLGARLLTQDLAPGKYLDLYGNPKANEGVKTTSKGVVTINTACKKITAKDHMRSAIKWGSAPYFDTWDREIGAPGAPINSYDVGEYSGVLSIHTAYYSSAAEHASMLKKFKTGTVHQALVHKFPAAKTGKINAGEQIYTRDGNMIEQKNALTGAKYTHCNNDWMFEDSWTNGTSLGLSLEHKMVCEDLWIVKMVYVKPSDAVDLLFQPTDEKVVPVTTAVNSTEYIKNEGHIMLGFETGTVQVEIMPYMIPVVKEMRERVYGKTRDVEVWKDHVSFTRSKCKNLEKSASIDVTYEDFSAVTFATYWMDFNVNVHNDQRMFDAHQITNMQASRLYTFGGGANSRYITSVALELMECATMKDRASGVRSVIDVFKRRAINRTK